MRRSVTPAATIMLLVMVPIVTVLLLLGRLLLLLSYPTVGVQQNSGLLTGGAQYIIGNMTPKKIVLRNPTNTAMRYSWNR